MKKIQKRQNKKTLRDNQPIKQLKVFAALRIFFISDHSWEDSWVSVSNLGFPVIQSLLRSCDDSDSHQSKGSDEKDNSEKDIDWSTFFLKSIISKLHSFQWFQPASLISRLCHRSFSIVRKSYKTQKRHDTFWSICRMVIPMYCKENLTSPS